MHKPGTVFLSDGLVWVRLAEEAYALEVDQAERLADLLRLGAAKLRGYEAPAPACRTALDEADGDS